jgi:hypothetical protein
MVSGLAAHGLEALILATMCAKNEVSAGHTL